MDVFGLTDIGCVRQNNEDSILWQKLADDRGCLAVLADGMGGYDGGALASKLAVERFTEGVLTTLAGSPATDDQAIMHLLEQAGKHANEAVREQRNNRPDLDKMGTTLVAMLLLDQQYWLMHAGDSRCYRTGKQGMQALTRDHSLVQELLDQGSISEQEAERAPFRNMLTRAVGPDSDVGFAFSRHSVQPGESWLLCSDGLYNTLSDTAINHWMQAGLSAEQTAQALIQESLQQNARDNVSVIVLKQDSANRSKQYGHISAAGG